MKLAAPPPLPATRGFTLIELLIVVAIIAILAAIAVPNFLEAQTRAKVSRAKSDLRTLATGIVAYQVDYSVFPIDGNRSGDLQARELPPTTLTSPIAYLTSLPFDPFQGGSTPGSYAPGSDEALFLPSWFLGYRYVNTRYKFNPSIGPTNAQLAQAWDSQMGEWYVYSIGPDRNTGPTFTASIWPTAIDLPHIYDPSNGTVSGGDIVRSHLSQ